LLRLLLRSAPAPLRPPPAPPPVPPWRSPAPPPVPPWRSLAPPPVPPWRSPAPPPVPPWRSPAPPPVPPWRTALPSAPPWSTPVPHAPPPAPSWRAFVLPVLPQSPGPPQGPGPPALALSCSRPTAPLDCYSVGASGSRSLGGGYVTNLVCVPLSTNHQMSLSHHLHTLTVTMHLGLHLPSSTALIASVPVTNQASYKNPAPPQCTSR
ncbi:hypothetical protein M9458_045257, partial [Cirrhinus mrigala]